MHHCFNVVTGKEHFGAAVLIRALEPLEGIEEMYRVRPKAKNNNDLLSGPAKLCQAFSIARAESNIDLLKSDTLFFTKGKLKKSETVTITTRIGITRATELPWRFLIADNNFISKGKPSCS